LPEALRGFAEYRMVIYSLLLIILMITRPQGLLGTTAAFKGWRGRKRKRARSRTQAEEITAEDTRDNQSVDKATMGERQRDTSLGEVDRVDKGDKQ
jgi:Flp pilus assembly protein TadB